MKRLILAGIVALGLTSLSDAHHKSWRHNDGFYGGIEATFHAPLAPYGEWIDCDFGTVWRPHSVGVHWRPYLHGRWVWTDFGWYWYSYEPFGWAVFHYGRWQYDDYYGWIWIPDRVWGPAWVEWRYDDNYIGWAPLTLSATFSVSLGVTLTHGWVAPVHYWNFVPCANFSAARVNEYVEPVEQTRRFFGSTRGVQNIRTENRRIVNRGVDINFIERKSGSRMKRVDVVENNRAPEERIVREQNRERLEIYRPQIEGSGSRTFDQPRRIGETRSNRSEDQSDNFMREWKNQQSERRQEFQERRKQTLPSVRQFRESEQKFEIPRNFEAEKNRLQESFQRRQQTSSQEDRTYQRGQTESVRRGEGMPRVGEKENKSIQRQQPPGNQDRAKPATRSGGRRP